MLVMLCYAWVVPVLILDGFAMLIPAQFARSCGLSDVYCFFRAWTLVAVHSFPLVWAWLSLIFSTEYVFKLWSCCENCVYAGFFEGTFQRVCNLRYVCDACKWSCLCVFSRLDFFLSFLSLFLFVVGGSDSSAFFFSFRQSWPLIALSSYRSSVNFISFLVCSREVQRR